MSLLSVSWWIAEIGSYGIKDHEMIALYFFLGGVLCGIPKLVCLIEKKKILWQNFVPCKGLVVIDMAYLGPCKECKKCLLENRMFGNPAELNV